MTQFVRRLRGALGIGLAWGVLWAALGAALAIIIGVVDPDQIGPGEGPARVALILGLVGFLSGLGFAGLLALAERRSTLHDLSLGRVALWGLLGGVAIPLLMGTDGSMGWLTGPMGAILATASVAAARRKALRNAKPSALLE